MKMDTMNATTTPTDRDEAIKTIRTALKKRSGKTWSVRGGKGTAWGWIEIDVPPAREGSRAADLIELAQLLGLETVHHQGVSIAAGRDYRQEYIDRAEGRAPSKIGIPYWD